MTCPAAVRLVVGRELGAVYVPCERTDEHTEHRATIRWT